MPGTDKTAQEIRLDERNHVEKPLLDQLDALGWTVLVASRSDYYDQPQAFLAQVRRAFAATAA